MVGFPLAAASKIAVPLIVQTHNALSINSKEFLSIGAKITLLNLAISKSQIFSLVIE